MKKYVMQIDADTSLFEKKVSNASAKVQKLSDTQVVVDIDYDHGDIDDIRRAVEAISQYSPKLKVQLAYDLISTIAKRKQEELEENLNLQNMLISGSPDKAALSKYVAGLMAEVEDGLQKGLPKGPLMEKMIRAMDISDSFAAMTKDFLDEEATDPLERLQESFKSLDKYKPNKNFLKNLPYTIEKDKKIIEGFNLQLDDLQNAGAKLDSVGSGSSGKIKFFDGVNEQILDVKDNAQEITNLLEKLSSEWSDIQFRTGSQFTDTKHDRDNLGIQLETAYREASLGAGTYFSQNYRDVHKWKKDNNYSSLYATNFDGFDKLLKFESEDYFYKFADAMRSMHAMIVKDIVPDDTGLYDDYLSGINNIHELYDRYKQQFQDLHVSEEALSNFIKEQQNYLNEFDFSKEIPKDLYDADSFTSKFLTDIVGVKGVSLSNLGSPDSTEYGSVLFKNFAKSLSYIDFGDNEELADRFAKMTLSKILKNKAYSPDTDLDEAYRLITGVNRKDYEAGDFNKMAEKAYYSADVLKSLYSTLNEAKQIQQNSISQTTAELNKDLFDSSSIDEYISKLERLLQLQQTINGLKQDTAHGKSYEEAARHIEKLNAQYQQTVSEIEKLKESGDDSTEIKERIGLLSNLAVSYRDAMEYSFPNDVSHGDWLKKYSSLSGNDLYGAEAMHTFKRVKQEADDFKSGLEKGILDTYREAHDHGFENLDLSDAKIKTDALSEIPEIMERITSAGKEATRTMEEEAEATRKAADAAKENREEKERASDTSDDQSQQTNQTREDTEETKKNTEEKKKNAEASEEQAEADEKAKEAAKDRQDAEEKANKTKEEKSEQSTSKEQSKEAEGFDSVREAAEKAAEAKNKFVESNIQAAEKASATASALEEEAAAFEKVSEAAKDAAGAKDIYSKSNNQTEEISDFKKYAEEQVTSLFGDGDIDISKYLGRIINIDELINVGNLQKAKEELDSISQDVNKIKSEQSDFETKEFARLAEAFSKGTVSATDYAEQLSKINDLINQGHYKDASTEVSRIISDVNKRSMPVINQAFDDNLNLDISSFETSNIEKISSALKEAGVSATAFASDFEKINTTLEAGNFKKAESQVDSLINKIRKAGDLKYAQTLKGISDTLNPKNILSNNRTSFENIFDDINIGDARNIFDEQGKGISKYLEAQRSRIESIRKRQEDSGKGFSGEVKDNINKATDAINEYSSAFDKIKDGSASIDEMAAVFNKGAEAIKACDTALLSMGDQTNKLIRANKIDNILQRFSKYDDIKLPSNLRDELDAMISRLSNLKNASDDVKQSFAQMSEADFNKIITEVSDLQTKLSPYNKKSFFSQFGSSVSAQSASFLAQYFSIQDYIRYAKEISTMVTQTDSALIELAKVSNASNERIAQSFETSTKSAHEYGATVTDMISSTADWARLGYSVDQAEELAKVTQLYVNVGDNITREAASQSLVSTLKGFQMDTSEAGSIVDKFNEV